MASAILQDLVDLVGHQASIELLRAFGGRRLKIPGEIHHDHALVFCVGQDAARKLAQAYGGTDLDVPAERNYLVDLRNSAIVAEFKRGRTISYLGHTYGVSRRQVNSILDRLGLRALRLERAAGTRT